MQSRVDDVLPMALFDVMQTGLLCLGAFVLMAIAVPFMLPIFAALMIVFYYFRCLLHSLLQWQWQWQCLLD